MKTLDAVFAFLGIALLAAFLTIIVMKVPVWPLILVFGVGVLMAAYDFVRAFRTSRANAAEEVKRTGG